MTTTGSCPVAGKHASQRRGGGCENQATRQPGEGVSAMGKKCAKQTRRKSFMFKNHVIYTTAKHCDKAKLRVFLSLKSDLETGK